MFPYMIIKFAFLTKSSLEILPLLKTTVANICIPSNNADSPPQMPVFCAEESVKPSGKMQRFCGSVKVYSSAPNAGITEIEQS